LQYNVGAIEKAQSQGKEEEATQTAQQPDCQAKIQQQSDPMTNFMYALKSKGSKRQYPRRFKMFLDYLKLDGLTSSINKEAKLFLMKTENDP
jgi:hypothetical protein